MSSTPVPAGDVATIARTRAFYEALARGCDSDVEQIEVALGYLAELQLDENTLDGFQSAQEDAQRAAGRCRSTVAVLNARQTLLEEAVNTTPDAAKTEFYQDGPARARASAGKGASTMSTAAQPTDTGDAGAPTTAEPDSLPDVLGVAGTPNHDEIIGSDQVPGQGKVPANVMLADWDSQPGWEPGGQYVVLQTPAPGEKDPSAAPMSAAEADEFADQLDDLADKAEQGVRPPKPSKYARSARRIEDDIKAGRAKPTDKLGWGDDDELPLTNKDLLDLLRKADPEGAKDNGTRTRVVCQAAVDAGSDEYATWAQITPDGRIAVTAIEGVGGSSNPDDEFWRARSSTHTPGSARELAGKLRAFAGAARRGTEAPVPPPAPAAGGPAPAEPRRIRNGRGEDTEYDPATGISYVIHRDGWRAPMPASSPAGVGARLLYMREEIKDGRGDAFTDAAARELLERMTIPQLREVADEIGAAVRGSRTKAQIVGDLVNMSVSAARKYRGLRHW